MSVPTYTWYPEKTDPRIERLLERPPFSNDAATAASKILRDVARRGDKAVITYARKFDRCSLTPKTLRISDHDIAASERALPPHWKKAIKETNRRVTLFAEQGLRKDWTMRIPQRGGMLGERFTPLDRVGVYIPGGAAPLASTVLMTVPMARVAGVKDIVVCTPSRKDGSVHPAILFALKVAGATEVYRIGGVQAIGAMAYGTATIAPVQKIVGPGNSYVTAAKRQVYGQVALDMLAGPSEVVILADDSANPAFVAADLLSQAEHGSGHEKAFLVTTSRSIAEAVRDELERQTRLLPRIDMIRRVMKSGMAILMVRNIDDGVALCNALAPEHLEVMTRMPEALRARLTRAGAIFEGPWSPEPAGDFAAGPSHVLPTGGTAAIFSGLTVEDFRRRTSILNISKPGLKAMLPTILAFSEMEGLDAHGTSGQIRFPKS